MAHVVPLIYTERWWFSHGFSSSQTVNVDQRLNLWIFTETDTILIDFDLRFGVEDGLMWKPAVIGEEIFAQRVHAISPVRHKFAWVFFVCFSAWTLLVTCN